MDNSMCAIKAILWDIDGTLLDFTLAQRQAIHACFAAFSLGTCTDEMLSDYAQINDFYWKKLERGEMTKPEILHGRFDTFFRRYHLDTSVIADFNDAYQIRLGDAVCFQDNAFELVSQLKKSVKQYAVTNGTKIAQRRKLKKSALETLFDGIFISDEIGFEKPSVDFFHAVFRAIPPFSKDEVMIVGDSLTSDIQGGINAGILTCWYNPKRQPPTDTITPNYTIDTLQDVLSICSQTQ